jgi:hypothetical protein
MKRPFATPDAPKIHTWSRATGADIELPFLKDPWNYDMNITGDPAFATNSWTAGYIVGTSYNSNWTTLGVWRTLDGGRTWSQPVAPSCAGCMHPRAGSSMLYDKPAIAVSYHSDTWAYVYVVMPFIDDHGVQTSTFYIARSTDGGQTFPVVGSVPGDGPLSVSSQIVVDNATGYLYLFFLTTNNRTITVWRSMNKGETGSWSKLSSLTVSTPELFGPGTDNLCSEGGAGPTCLTARSMLVANFNPTVRTVGLVLHGRVSSTDRRAKPSFYSLNLGDSPTWTATWTVTNVPFVPGESGSGSQWNPAIDYDKWGNFVISYYDRRETPSGQPSDTLYKVYITKLTPSGSHVYADQAVTGTFADPRDVGNSTFPLGEYQGLWTFDWNVYSAYVFTRPTQGINQEDIYYTPMLLP